MCTEMTCPYHGEENRNRILRVPVLVQEGPENLLTGGTWGSVIQAGSIGRVDTDE